MNQGVGAHMLESALRTLWGRLATIKNQAQHSSTRLLHTPSTQQQHQHQRLTKGFPPGTLQCRVLLAAPGPQLPHPAAANTCSSQTRACRSHTGCRGCWPGRLARGAGRCARCRCLRVCVSRCMCATCGEAQRKAKIGRHERHADSCRHQACYAACVCQSIGHASPTFTQLLAHASPLPAHPSIQQTHLQLSRRGSPQLHTLGTGMR